MVRNTQMMFWSLEMLFTGKVPLKEMRGIVAITKIGSDVIEKQGIERSRKAIEQAQIILEVIDATCPEETMQGEKVVHVYNKADLHRVPGQLCVSAKQGDISALKQYLVEAAGKLQTEGNIISSVRHYEALCRALAAIRKVQDGMQNGLSGEWLSEDLQDCLNALGEITGQITSQEVLNNIFSKFCIGK